MHFIQDGGAEPVVMLVAEVDAFDGVPRIDVQIGGLILVRCVVGTLRSLTE
jgi:hypothetical protein